MVASFLWISNILPLVTMCVLTEPQRSEKILFDDPTKGAGLCHSSA